LFWVRYEIYGACLKILRLYMTSREYRISSILPNQFSFKTFGHNNSRNVFRTSLCVVWIEKASDTQRGKKIDCNAARSKNVSLLYFHPTRAHKHKHARTHTHTYTLTTHLHTYSCITVYLKFHTSCALFIFCLVENRFWDWYTHMKLVQNSCMKFLVHIWKCFSSALRKVLQS